MAITHAKRKKIRICYERLGLLLLGCLVTVFILNGYPMRSPGAREQSQTSFDIQENGVVVVLELANTGMDTLTNYIIRHAILDPPCHCPDQLTKCKCLNRQGNHWLFHAFNTTGYVCGEHSDFTSLTTCPIDHWFRTSGKDTRPFRKYLPITLIRDPLPRYVSQWLSLKHEDTFLKNEPRLFRNQSVELQKKGLACYLGKTLSSLSLRDFINCSENGAGNHQTRMLANMTQVRSLGLTGRDFNEAMLASAKMTLQMLPFFGIYDRPNDTQKLLESTLGFKFRQSLEFDDPYIKKVLPLSATLQHQILQINNLDLRLYQFARELFKARVKDVRYQIGSPDSKSLVDNFRIIYRPDLTENNVIQSTGDINDDGNNGFISNKDMSVSNYGLRQNGVGDGQTDGRSSYTGNKKFSQQGAPMTDYDRVGENVDFDISDTNINEDYGNNLSEKKYLPHIDGEISQVKLQSSNYKPSGDIRPPDHKSDVQSPDSKPDEEDVNVFLSRLEKLKQLKKMTSAEQMQLQHKVPQQQSQQEAPQQLLPSKTSQQHLLPLKTSQQHLLPLKTSQQQLLQQKTQQLQQQTRPQQLILRPKTPQQQLLQQKAIQQLLLQQKTPHQQQGINSAVSYFQEHNNIEKNPSFQLGPKLSKSGVAPKGNPAVSARDIKPHEYFILNNGLRVTRPAPSTKNVYGMIH